MSKNHRHELHSRPDRSLKSYVGFLDDPKMDKIVSEGAYVLGKHECPRCGRKLSVYEETEYDFFGSCDNCAIAWGGSL
jgi:ssDNA-binding Zn-finger/Zn-ribbon topoisomerase 1